jgi:hypothetical protein
MCKPPFGFTGIAGNRASGDKAVSIFTNKMDFIIGTL